LAVLAREEAWRLGRTARRPAVGRVAACREAVAPEAVAPEVVGREVVGREVAEREAVGREVAGREAVGREAVGRAAGALRDVVDGCAEDRASARAEASFGVNAKPRHKPRKPAIKERMKPPV